MNKEKLRIIKNLQKIEKQLRQLNKTNQEVLNELQSNTESR